VGNLIPLVPIFGNSIVDGVAPLSGVSSSDMARWTGSALPASDFPFEAQAPGVKMLTPRLPYATAATRNITAVPTTTTFTMESAVSGTTVDQWVYVLENTTGQGQLRKISANPATVTPTVSAAFSPTLAVNGQVQILGSSHTADTGGTTTRIIKTSATTAFTSADVGKWIVVMTGAQAGTARKITAFVSATTVDISSSITALSGGEGLRLLTGTNAVNSMSDLVAANCSFENFRFYYDFAPTYSTGLEYPNFKSTPFTGPLAHKSAQYVNFIPELAWQFRSRYDQPIHVVPIGVSAATLAPSYVGTFLQIGAFSWAYDLTHLDFHPASPNGIFHVTKQLILAARDIIVANGDTPFVPGIFSVIAENDAADNSKTAAFLANMRTLRASLREFLTDQELTPRNPHLTPFITSNIRTTSISANGALINSALATLAADDSRTRVIDSTSVARVDGIHDSGAGVVTRGELFFSAWSEVDRDDNYASRATADLPTLATLRARVRLRFERSTSSNDSDTSEIDMFLNDSYQEIVRTLGDNAWFMRRAESATLDSGAFPNTIVLDANVSRVMRIESAAYPGKQLVWKGISHTSNLRTQITLHDYCPGPFIVHFMQLPQKLVVDTDVVVIPDQYTELLILLTCKRLSECIGNANLAMYYSAECARIWKDVKRDCLRYDRMRQEAMTAADGYDTLRNTGAWPNSWSL